MGLASSADEGALHVPDYALVVGSGGGAVVARATYAGPNTKLGNPVDISGSDDDVFVAEKANGGGRILRFANVLGASGMQNVAPAAMNGVRAAESVDAVDRDAYGETPSSGS